MGNVRGNTRIRAPRLLALGAALACAACGLDRAGLGAFDAGYFDAGAGGAAGARVDGAGAGGVDGAAGRPDAARTDAGGIADALAEVGTDAPVISPIGCADGTREGFLNVQGYPLIAACAGGWDVPGLLSANALAPQCGRQGGNSGPSPAGAGCSVADLCAEGWHVCLTAHEVFQNAGDCKDAVGPAGTNHAFFVTRQRALGNTCPAANDVGTNHLHGCGNFGSPEDKTCIPFMLMLKNTDCAANSPWSCPIVTNVTTTYNEYETVTKVGPAHGGALCCRN